MKRLLKVSYISYLLLPLIVFPVLARLMHDPFILFGIACYYIGVLLGALKQSIFVPIPVLFAGWYWYTYGIKINQYVTIFFIALIAGFAFQILLKQFDRFIHRTIPEQQLMDDYDNKIAEMTNRLEQYKRDHPNEKLTQDIIENIKQEVFFGKAAHQ